MGSVVNRATVEYRGSINTPDYSDVDWIINPDLSALASIPHKYWKVFGDNVVEMDQSEKDAVDAAEAAAQAESIKRGRKVDGYPVAILDDVVNNTAYRVVGKIPVLGTLYPSDLLMSFIVHAYVEAGNTGTIRIYDMTNARELGVITVTETSLTIKTVDLSNVPVEQNAVIEIHGKIAAGGQKMYLEAATLELYR